MGGQGAARHHLVTEGAGEVLLWDFCRAANPSFAQGGGGPLGRKRCTRASKFLRFTCFVTLVYTFCRGASLLRRSFCRGASLLRHTFCCGASLLRHTFCCGAPFTAHSSCSRVLWFPLQPIQSCPRAAFGYNAWCFVPLAQWIRASASGAEGRRFESCKGHQIGQPGLLHAARVFLYKSVGRPYSGSR